MGAIDGSYLGLLLIDLLRRITTMPESMLSPFTGLVVHERRPFFLFYRSVAPVAPQAFMSFIITGSYIVYAQLILIARTQSEANHGTQHSSITVLRNRHEDKLDLSGPEIRGAVPSSSTEDAYEK
jgi:hypothetical protein